MMNAPENHMVTMTAKGIEQMIGRAVEVVANENRKLKFLLGLSLGDALDDNDPPQTVDQMLDVLHAIANNHPSWKNPQIPSDLLITAGVMAMKSHLATVKAMVEGDRPQPPDEYELCEILHNFSNELNQWFTRRHPEKKECSLTGNEELEADFYRKVQSDRIQAIAMMIMDQIDLSVPVPNGEIFEIEIGDGDL